MVRVGFAKDAGMDVMKRCGANRGAGMGAGDGSAPVRTETAGERKVAAGPQLFR
jgi:hypothetical protein